MSKISHEVKSQPDVVFFDAAGTLIHLARPVGWYYAKVAQHQGLEISEEAMEQSFRSAWSSAPARSPGVRPDDDKGWWQTVATRTLEGAVRIPAGFNQMEWFETLYEHFAQPGVWLTYEDVEPVLERLRGKYRLAVLSNFDGRLRRILHDLKIDHFFEKIFISSEIGFEKPDREAFLHATRQMSISSAHGLHVGDDPARDWRGAEAAGLPTFPLHRPEKSLAELPLLLGL